MTVSLSKLTKACLLSIVLVSCASNDEDPDLLPADRPEIKNTFNTQVIWSKSVADGVESYYSRLKPTWGYDKVFAADRTGAVVAFAADTGKQVWEVDIRPPSEGYLSWLGFNTSPESRVSGLVASYEKLFVGTENGEIVALSVEDGHEIWRVSVDGEVLSAPIAEEGKVIAHLGSGTTVALDANDGKEIWSSIADVPSLTLRGASSPAYAQGGVFIGGATGKVMTYASQNGQLAWEVPIAKPQGATELARIADIDATPIISGFNLYALSAGGSLGMVDIRSARLAWKREYRGYQNMVLDANKLILSDDKSILYAVDARTGVELWSNNQLRNRHITAGAILGDYVLVGDFEGYIYLFDKEEGKLSYVRQISTDALLAQPIVENDIAYIQTRDGEIVALKLN
ncbi:outer membrane protein assembly factor BamB [Catenovulum sediminis]|uniref:outer membrane protein assembly factor BamB n=1 Tax=Catenovulum sediminis TaxID=1740262 RepID=UPI00117C4F0F|nr:outer membrane protein assembly factor BamB [Catenovulum sediminis]